MVHTLPSALSTVGCTGRMRAVLGHERWMEVADSTGCMQRRGGVAVDHDGRLRGVAKRTGKAD